MNTKNNRIFIAYGLIVFAGLLLFFTVINPLIVYDADDWLYVYSLRKPIPLPNTWNPTRVFFETFMPIVSYFGALVINPLINNYYFSLTLAHGIFASFLLTLYFTEFSLLFYKRGFASTSTSIKYGCLFILLHFISHIFAGSSNFFLLYSPNLTCFYNYTLAVILNACIVMHFMSYGGIKAFFKSSTLLHKVFIFVCLYFAIFSNLFSSVVLATYVGTELLLDLTKDIKNKQFKLFSYVSDNLINLIIIVIWFIANILETTGGRADDIHKAFFPNVLFALGIEIASIIISNLFVLIFEVVVFVLWLKKCERQPQTQKRFLLYLGFGMIYLTLLGTFVNFLYLIRPDVSIGMFFYIYLALIACLSQLIKQNKKYAKILYILCGTLVLLLIKPGTLYNHYNYSNISYEQCKAVTYDIIDQIKEAESEGKTEVDVIVPKFEMDDTNWPLSTFVNDRFSEVFYKHKVIDSPILVRNIIVSEEKNEELNIPTKPKDFPFDF